MASSQWGQGGGSGQGGNGGWQMSGQQGHEVAFTSSYNARPKIVSKLATHTIPLTPEQYLLVQTGANLKLTNQEIIAELISNFGGQFLGKNRDLLVSTIKEYLTLGEQDIDQYSWAAKLKQRASQTRDLDVFFPSLKPANAQGFLPQSMSGGLPASLLLPSTPILANVQPVGSNPGSFTSAAIQPMTGSSTAAAMQPPVTPGTFSPQNEAELIKAVEIFILGESQKGYAPQEIARVVQLQFDALKAIPIESIVTTVCHITSANL